MDSQRAQEQLTAIADLVKIAGRLGAPLWLRGGWAVDFVVGRVTRDHKDIDWFALGVDGPNLSDALARTGFRDVTTAASGQQIDFARGSLEHGIALIRIGPDGEPLVAGGPWAGDPWPTGMLDGQRCRIDDVEAQVISVAAQIEIKRMMPTWNPRLERRKKDLDDIAALEAAV